MRGALFVLSSSGAISRVDPGTREVTPVPVNYGMGVYGQRLRSDGDKLYVQVQPDGSFTTLFL